MSRAIKIGNLEQPLRRTVFSSGQLTELENEFLVCAQQKSVLVVVLSDDTKMKKHVEEFADKARKICVYLACCYVTPNDVKKEGFYKDRF